MICLNATSENLNMRYQCPNCKTMGASSPGRNPLCHICNYKIEMLPIENPMLSKKTLRPQNDISIPSSLTLGHWWLHTPSNTLYQLRRLPQTMDKMNDKQSGIVLWHRDHKIAIHLPVEIPSDFQYLGPGHNEPPAPQPSRTT
jgi:hypothetical protein